MSEDYSNYIFELGKDPVRTYKGERMRPLSGTALAYEVYKVLANVFSEMSGEEIDKENMSTMLIVSKCLSHVDVNVYMGFLKRVTSSTLIIAKVAGDTKTYTLDNDTKIDAWFSKYPQDLIKFGAQIIWENVSLFLPEEFQNLRTAILKA